MDITTKTVLRHFLERDLMAPAEELDPFFMDFFVRGELVEMLKWRYGMPLNDHLRLDTMDNGQLLDYLRDRDILGYFLKQWDGEQNLRVLFSRETVDGLLEQLGQNAHYLREKPVHCWDSYDYSNYRNLRLRAGWLQTVFGIYDRDISQEDVEEVDSHPKRFFGSYMRAESALKEHPDNEDLHILYRHIPV